MGNCIKHREKQPVKQPGMYLEITFTLRTKGPHKNMKLMNGPVKNVASCQQCQGPCQRI